MKNLFQKSEQINKEQLWSQTWYDGNNKDTQI